MKQTAVEWLVYMLKEQGLLIGEPDNLITVKQAKEMEKQQHGKTWDTALDKYEVRAGNYMRAYEDFDDYFAETYGSKGSDSEIPNVCSSQTKVNETHNSPKVENKDSFGEISDEEIHKAATNYSSLYYEFRAGANWYREQLKSRQ